MTDCPLDAIHWTPWVRWIGIPLMSALIGWLTNALAVKMIFRPHKPLNLLLFKIHGLVPKRQNELAVSIAQTVQRHLISHTDIQEILRRPGVQAEMEGMIRERVGVFLKDRLTSLNPMVGMFLGGGMRDKLEGMLTDEVRQWLPMFSGHFIERIEDELDFQRIVEERVRAFDLNRLEGIILEIASRELKAIEWLGGAIGFLIGLLQAAIVAL